MLRNIKKLLLPVVTLGLVLSVGAIIHSTLATGETITASGTATTEIKTATPIAGVTVNGTDNSTVPVKLLVTNGTLAMTTTTGLTFKDVNGNTLSNPQTGSTLYFSGARSDVNAALATLKYTRNTTGTDTLEISLVNPGEVFFPGTGHLYEYVSSTLDWNGANSAAAARTKYGATGYLVTITSQAENDFVSARLADAGWMGASDVASEGQWKWVTGPESGTLFCSGDYPPGCTTQSGQYSNWNSGEPNNSGNNENCAQFLSGGTGKWNDLPCGGSTLPGYVVEYGTPGNMPSVAAANITLTTSDTTPPTTPGTPSTTSPTTTQKPTWSWTASTDGGVGLASPAYTVQWSQDATFTTGINSATAGTTSFTHATNLGDGTWYFRVKATDLSGNASAYSPSASVVVDTTAPTAPTITSASSVVTATTPSTLSWSVSSDSGIGLANPAYTVQWSQSSLFSSGLNSATTSGSPYTTVSLTQGIWYFRVKATDSLGNVSGWSSTVTINYDATPPSTPGTPSTGTPTNNAAPTWSWTAASDSDSDLANPAYTVQWSQDATFITGVSSGTTNTTSFTQPSSLASGTWYFRVKATNNAGTSSSYSSNGSVAVDTNPPGITNILATTNADTSETVAWTTDKISSSQVQYGPTVAYGSTTVTTDTSPRITTHSVMLSSLVACTLYHYKVISVDAVTNSTISADNNFITSGCAGTATVTAHADTIVPMSTGGNVSLSSGGNVVSLGVPVNFANVDADFQIKKLDTASAFDQIGTPPNLAAVGSVYDIKAMQNTTTAITSFNNDVAVTMTYSSDDLASFQENTFVIYRWDSGPGWQKLHSCSTDTSARTVTCYTDGFSTFALFGEHSIVATIVGPAAAKHTSSSKNNSVVSPVGSATTTPTTSNDGQEAQPTQISLVHETSASSGKNSNKIWYSVFALLILAIFWWLIAVLKRRSHDDKDNK